MPEIGKILVTIGIALVVIGTLLTFNPLHLGRLPGDILIKKGNVTFYVPIATSIVMSIVLSLVFWFLGRKP